MSDIFSTTKKQVERHSKTANRIYCGSFADACHAAENRGFYFYTDGITPHYHRTNPPSFSVTDRLSSGYWLNLDAESIEHGTGQTNKLHKTNS